jgi:hypothetical protein
MESLRPQNRAFADRLLPVRVPKGDYRQIQFLLIDAESGTTEVINRPWN